MERQSLVLPSMPEDLLLFLTTRMKKIAVWKTTFMSEHLATDQSQMTKCFALVACVACCGLHAARENHVKNAKQSTLMCSFKYAHLCINKMRRCV